MVEGGTRIFAVAKLPELDPERGKLLFCSELDFAPLRYSSVDVSTQLLKSLRVNIN